MAVSLDDLRVFSAVAGAGGFREASRIEGTSASSASEAVRRLERQIGVPLLHRTTRSVAPTEAGARLLERVMPALKEIDAALDAAKSSRDRPAGTVRLNVPTVAARVVLPRLLPAFLAAHPDIRVEVTAEDELVDVLAAGCDAGIRYAASIERDMIAVPIGPRQQRFAFAASPDYVARRGRPRHPRDLLEHACLRVRFPNGALIPWELERDGEVVRLEPTGPLVTTIASAADVLVPTAIAGGGIVCTFEDWVRPHIETGALVPILERWWPRFPGPLLYYPSRRHVPPAFRAFVDFVRSSGG